MSKIIQTNKAIGSGNIKHNKSLFILAILLSTSNINEFIFRKAEVGGIGGETGAHPIWETEAARRNV